MTDNTFAQPSRTARARRLLTTLLLTAALLAAVAAANNTDVSDAWRPPTGRAFTPPTGPQNVGAPTSGTIRPHSTAWSVGPGRACCTQPRPGSVTIRPDSAACRVSPGRPSCAHPTADSVPAGAGSAVWAPLTLGVRKTALFLPPVAAGLTVTGRTCTRTRTCTRSRQATFR